ncbi:MAG TPA: DNA topoisomerase 3 [Candidatus Akkermansia intestinigallinarum]|uniref:DNA topoisomerase n=1 Tax=Candidatus Akkermansia intestinigallinarum TaxID=2838431 RepID=A0A9D2AH81_9BACT|nr:DNA topoisomerase 3 [Candidatus Akkermansia intestinigallinarum]
MSKTLIIAEKPSVATDLARVLGKRLGKFSKDSATGSYSNDTLIITSAVGHLVEQKKPQTADGKSLPWKMDYLPVMPAHMELEPIAKSADRLKKVLKLARSKEVTALVNACDAGREGELIFRNIIRFGNIRKPISRLWMQSMTDDAILEAWSKLKSDADMADLADAAVCRSESDWLVGLNSTRALTVLQSAAGGFNVTPTGRVQTPTLALLAARQKEILAFVPEPYYEVHATFQAQAGNYEGKWINPDWRKNPKEPQKTRDRIWDEATARAIAERCRGREGRVSETKKPVSVPAPQLFDLTSLQREASNRFGFSARRTLQLAQECYEKHKVLTYPRTDSKYLPDDYLKIAARTVEAIRDNLPEFAPHARGIIERRGIKPGKRVFDSSKVSDHFAIIPTGRFVSLSGDAARIFTLVVQRFLGVFMPNAEYEDTERTTIIQTPEATDTFYTHGRVQLSPGWRALYPAGQRDRRDELCPVTPQERVTAQQVDARQDQTKAPAPYTEATLLTAMESAGKLVDDEELAYAMKERGLGTPATRAAIIEGLITQEYIVRDGKELIATRRGMDLIDLLGKIGLSTLSSPELTGEWEYRLKQMESGRLDRDTFMKDIRRYTTEIVDAVRDYMKNGKNPDLPLTCPACGAQGLGSRVDAVSCNHCKFRIRRVHAGLSLTDDQMSELITRGELPVMEGFRSKFGKPFKAGLRLVKPQSERATWKAEFYFENDNPPAGEPGGSESQGLVDVKDHGQLELFLNDKQWSIPDYPLEGSTRKGFTMSRIILGQQIERNQLDKLLATGKTDLITGFISQRTRRPFDAYLTIDPKKGNVAFEFPPRETKHKTDPAGSKAARRFTASDATREDLSQATKHGPIKIKGKGEHELLETENAWHIDGLAYGKTRKPLVIPHTMCGITLSLDLVTQLLTKGKTELIRNFVSHKTGRPFDAYLTFTPATGKVGYEFPPRES